MPFLGEEELFDELPVDQRSCRLLGPTALIVQGLMGLLVILSLVFKRHRESPKRPWRIWSFDVSKQIIGQMFVHGVNVLISGVVASLSSGNACVLYFLNILIDTTLGVAIIYIILHSLTFLFTEKFGLKGFETGKYGNPPRFGYWFRQLSVYVFALTTMKLLVIALFVVWPGIFKLGEWLLTFLGPSDAAQVIFTMGIFPIIMNVMQFWIIDSIVKANAHSPSVALPSDSARNSLEDEEPLFRASMDDDDDDDDPRPHDIENPPARSRSVSRDRHDSLPDETKSDNASSATATASGSVTPKAIDVPSNSIAMHAYPPSLASTSTSPRSSRSPSSRATSSSPRPRLARRSPPPRLSYHPRSPQPLAFSPHEGFPLPSHTPNKASEDDHDEKWASWDDGDANDWGDHGGEDGWTRQRLDARKSLVQNVWADDERESSVRISTR